MYVFLIQFSTTVVSLFWFESMFFVSFQGQAYDKMQEPLLEPCARGAFSSLAEDITVSKSLGRRGTCIDMR